MFETTGKSIYQLICRLYSNGIVPTQYDLATGNSFINIQWSLKNHLEYPVNKFIFE